MTSAAAASKRAERALVRAARDREARLAAGAVAGAGVAAAATKAVLDRRGSAAGDDGPPRKYRLRRSEPPAAGIRRVAEGRAMDALEQIRGQTQEDREDAIHETRKDLKKLRSVLRLVRDELGDDAYRRENTRFRDVGRTLSGARDAQVKLETAKSLRERFGDRLDESSLRRYEAALEADRGRQAEEVSGGEAVDRAAAEIEAGHAAIAEWPLDADDWSLVEPGLDRSYRRGRARFADVRAAPSDEAVHEWRKRVKDLWYQLRILRNSWKPVMAETGDQAHELADLLGDHHDLAVLRDDALARRELWADGELESFAEAIAERQDELIRDALVRGERLYAEKPKAFKRRMRAYWEAWRQPA
jgi:CHAD domain-containing protein